MSYEFLGDDMKKAGLARAKAIAQGLPDPGIPLMVTLNDAAARALRPVAPMIRAAPILSADDKADLLSRPIDWFCDIFDPIEDAVGRAVDRVLAQKGNTQNYFGFHLNLKRVQSADARADQSTRNLLKRLRTILAFIVLPMTQPIEFAGALIHEGLDIASHFRGLFGVGDLGVAGGDDAAAAAGAAAAEAGSTALTAAISSAITAIVSTIGTVVTGQITNTITNTFAAPAATPVTKPSGASMRPFLTAQATPVKVQAGIPSWAIGLGLGLGALGLILYVRR